MRFRLLRRRLTISAPRMAVRSAMPWPLRWVVVAIVLGFCAAIGLWAFEFGKDIAGLDKDAKEELVKLRDEAKRLREERDKAQSVANTSGSLLTAERAAQEKLATQIRQLEADNRSLRDDLGFFEKLIPSPGAESIAIRGVQAELLSPTQLRWQVLVIQAVKNAPQFTGKIELALSGIQGGKPWSATVPEGGVAVQLQQYRRIEGVYDLPPSTVLKAVTVKLTKDGVVKAVQNVRL
ncbi:MAG: hypothetical protein IPK34_14455 [Ramlibacter sp.]|jgi:hypothetical protein|nr:hypothetical protein [Ramlibacter sp.]